MRLGKVIADYRHVNRIGVREMAREIGTSHSTLSRIERGLPSDAKTLVKILDWLLHSKKG